MSQIASQQYDALEKGLNRASVSVHEAGYEKLLAELFELDIDATKTDVPAGAILAQRFFSNKLLNEDHWLRAIPVNLVPDRDQLLLYQAEEARRNLPESYKQQIVEELTRVFDDLFAEIHVDEESGWLFRLKKPAQITTSSLHQVSGKNIQAYLPKGNQAKQWIAVFNEIQMILHAEDSARHGFNALWFEGAGSLPQINPTLKLGTIGNETLFQAVSEYCHARHFNETTDLGTSIGGLERLIVSDTNLQRAIAEQSEELLQRSVQAADVQFSQMLSLLDAGQLSEIIIYLLNGRQYSIGKAGVLSFLKRRKKLSDLLENNN